MGENIIKPFPCETIEKSLLRSEWEKWLRAFNIYLDAEEIETPSKKRNKLLHLGGVQLQTVVYSLPGALVDINENDQVDVFVVLINKLNDYFSPKQNSTFERHLFRNLSPLEGESFAKFMIRLRQQMQKCHFGSTKAEIEEICLKDKIMDSWTSLDLKRKLLGKEHTLAEVMEACRVEEEITKQSQSILPKSDNETVGKIAARKPNRDTECGRCGRTGHTDDSSICPARQVKCNKCMRFGHFARKCRTSLKRQLTQPNNSGAMRSRAEVRRINEEGSQSEIKPGKEKCLRISSDDENEELIECSIGGQPIP